MASQLKNEKFLHNYGGLEANDLTNLLNCDSETDENAATVIKVSNYHDIDDLLNKNIFPDRINLRYWASTLKASLANLTI